MPTAPPQTLTGPNPPILSKPPKTAEEVTKRQGALVMGRNGWEQEKEGGELLLVLDPAREYLSDAEAKKSRCAIDRMKSNVMYVDEGMLVVVVPIPIEVKSQDESAIFCDDARQLYRTSVHSRKNNSSRNENSCIALRERQDSSLSFDQLRRGVEAQLESCFPALVARVLFVSFRLPSLERVCAMTQTWLPPPGSSAITDLGTFGREFSGEYWRQLRLRVSTAAHAELYRVHAE
ncbi:hypothetical protein C8R45DRAFT_942768 [Mycena sanguinolenta]|nr:hypothetical protein C8R45DRAFT_942768 [Mycena sanguinolenta]